MISNGISRSQTDRVEDREQQISIKLSKGQYVFFRVATLVLVGLMFGLGLSCLLGASLGYIAIIVPVITVLVFFVEICIFAKTNTSIRYKMMPEIEKPVEIVEKSRITENKCCPSPLHFFVSTLPDRDKKELEKMRKARIARFDNTHDQNTPSLLASLVKWFR